MLSIDGAQKSGSGTIVRNAVALSALTGRPVRVFNARRRRRTPGLRPQHVTAVLACAAICGGGTEGVSVGSTEFTFVPGARLAGGNYNWAIGTAGSTTMLALSVLPVACFADRPLSARMEGGIFQDFAPSPHHLQHALAPLVGCMGARVSLQVSRPGYVPRGAGVIELTVTPAAAGLTPLRLTEPGVVSRVRGVALSSHLASRRVSERMASACAERLQASGLACDIDCVNDTTAAHTGASLAIWAESTTGCRFGADRAGRFDRSSEAIGRFVAATFLEDLRSGATVDRHLADQLVVFAALARGASRYLVPRTTEHLDANLWLVEQFGARTTREGGEVVVDGLALSAPRPVSLMG